MENLLLRLDYSLSNIAHQSLNLSAQIDTNERLSDIQVSEVMNITSRTSSIDAMKSSVLCFHEKQAFVKTELRFISILVGRKIPDVEIHASLFAHHGQRELY